jgi:phospholipase D
MSFIPNDFNIIPKRKYRNLFRIVAVSFLFGVVVGYTGNNEDILKFFDNKGTLPVKRELDPILIGADEVSTCFTPPAGCGTVIASQISKAQDSIYVQAYGFTSGEISKALINAHTRGVKVRVLLDKSNIGAKHSKMRDLREAGIEVDISHLQGR